MIFVSEIVKLHVPCEFCGSSDGATIYTDHKFCFVCEKYTWLDGKEEGGRGVSSKHLPVIPKAEMEIRPLKARGITSETCRKYGYHVSKNDYGQPIQVADYCKDGRVIFQKTRDREKNFMVRGKKDHIFFGQHLFSTGKKLVITEGEIDCLSVAQVVGEYPVVSIPNGAANAKEAIKHNFCFIP